MHNTVFRRILSWLSYCLLLVGLSLTQFANAATLITAPFNVSPTQFDDLADNTPLSLSVGPIIFRPMGAEAYLGRTNSFVVRFTLADGYSWFLGVPQVLTTSSGWSTSIVAGGAGSPFVSVLVSPTSASSVLTTDFSLSLVPGTNGIAASQDWADSGAPLTASATMIDNVGGQVIDSVGATPFANVAGSVNSATSVGTYATVTVVNGGYGALTSASVLELGAGATLSVSTSPKVEGSFVLLSGGASATLYMGYTTGLIATSNVGGNAMTFQAMPVTTGAYMIPVVLSGSVNLSTVGTGPAFGVLGNTTTLFSAATAGFAANCTVNANGSSTVVVTAGSGSIPFVGANGASKVQTLYPGDTLTFSANGSLLNAQIANATIGEPITSTPPSGYSYAQPGVQVGGVSQHLGGARVDSSIANTASTLLGQTLVDQGLDATGNLELGFNGGTILANTVAIALNPFAANSTWLTTGDLQMSLGGGLVVEESPAVANLANFTSFILSTFGAGTTVTQQANGVLVIKTSTATHIVRPSWVTTPSKQPAGYYASNAVSGFTIVDASGNAQVFYPTFANLQILRVACQSVDRTASPSVLPDGSVSVTLKGQSYRFVPNEDLITTPDAHTADLYWISGSQIFLNNEDGSSQGFTVH